MNELYGEIQRNIEMYYERIFKYCLAYLRHKEDAEDCAQEVFQVLVEKLDTFETTENLEGWLYQTAHYKVIKFTKRRQKLQYSQVSYEVHLEQGGSEPHSLEDFYAFLEVNDEQILQEVLGSLKKEEQRLYELRFKNNLPYAKVGALMGLTEQTAKTRGYRLGNKIKKKCLKAVEKIEKTKKFFKKHVTFRDFRD